MLQTTNGKLPTTMLIYKPKGNLQTVAIMIEVTSRRIECTLLTSNYSQMPAVALHKQRNSRLLRAKDGSESDLAMRRL